MLVSLLDNFNIHFKVIELVKRQPFEQFPIHECDISVLVALLNFGV